jgi:hypothetical protein
MDKIYIEALFTIVAASGSHSEAGIAGVQPGSRAKKQFSEIVDGEEIFVSLPLLKEALEPIHESHEGMNGSNGHKVSRGNGWISRGWTMQEGLLSGKCLIFTSSQVFWKTRGEMCCESIAEVFDHQRASAARPPHGDIFCAPGLMRNASSGLYFGTESYYFELASAYSRRVLSFDSDRLRAFKGISNAMQTTYGSKFLWGLPEDIFDFVLLWVPTSLDGSKARDIRFPSWCWASWPGSVDYYVLDQEAHRGIAGNEVLRSASSIRKTNVYWKFNKKGDRKKIVQKRVRYPSEIEEKYDCLSDDGNLKYILHSKPQCEYYLKQLSDIDPPTGELDLDVLAGLTTQDDNFLPLVLFLTTTITLYLVRATNDNRVFQCRCKPVSESRATRSLGDLEESIFVDDARDLLRLEGKGCDFIVLSKCESPGAAVMNVMLIERLKNGVARRLGIGYILPKTWSQANPVQEWVLLQ